MSHALKILFIPRGRWCHVWGLTITNSQTKQEVGLKPVEWFWLPYHKAGILHGHVVNELLLLKIKSSPCSIVISSTLKNSIGPFILDEMGAGTEATPGSPRTLTVHL